MNWGVQPPLPDNSNPDIGCRIVNRATTADGRVHTADATPTVGVGGVYWALEYLAFLL